MYDKLSFIFNVPYIIKIHSWQVTRQKTRQDGKWKVKWKWKWQHTQRLVVKEKFYWRILEYFSVFSFGKNGIFKATVFVLQCVHFVFENNPKGALGQGKKPQKKKKIIWLFWWTNVILFEKMSRYCYNTKSKTVLTTAIMVIMTVMMVMIVMKKYKK